MNSNILSFRGLSAIIGDFERLDIYREPTERHICALPSTPSTLLPGILRRRWEYRCGDLGGCTPALHRVFGVLVLIRQSEQVETTILEQR
ncbi:MAG: hypothetical protein HRT36_04950 [Alphaproteobacteria bacterium]|nr:hypothetical protein [Alphaproteobacteria bacterium]